MRTYNRGIILTLILIVIGFVLVLTLIGFFRTGTLDSKLNFTVKSILKEPCGLSIKTPHLHESVTFPLEITGYINGCGWEPRDDRAGTVVLYSDHGMPLTPPVTLLMPPQAEREPYYFESIINIVPPSGTKEGILIFENNRGNGLSPEFEEYEISFK